MISHFFIDRPTFAAVLSIVITLAGAIALLNLPVAQYPEVAPPVVQVTAVSPSANAKTVLETLVVPVSKAVRREVTDYVDYSGRTVAVNSVHIRQRVTG